MAATPVRTGPEQPWSLPIRERHWLRTPNSFDSNGWFVGGGVENNLDIFGIHFPGLFMKTEYRVAQYDRKNIQQLDDVTGLPAFDTIQFKPVVQTISTSLVYRFNWGGPAIGAGY